MVTVGEAFHAAARKAASAVTTLADVIAPPLELRTVTKQPWSICHDPDHDDPEGACPTCGQGPRRK